MTRDSTWTQFSTLDSAQILKIGSLHSDSELDLYSEFKVQNSGLDSDSGLDPDSTLDFTWTPQLGILHSEPLSWESGLDSDLTPLYNGLHSDSTQTQDLTETMVAITS